VRAGYMVYQGIKHKSLGMVLGGVASLVSGAGNVAGALGASTATVGTISSVASAASKLSMAYNAVANKDIGAAMGLLGGVSGVQGTALGTAAGYVQQGMGIRQAVRSGDAAAALSGTFGLAQSVSQQLGAGVAQQQQQREAEAADNRGLLNAADRDLRAMPAEQDGAVTGGPSIAHAPSSTQSPAITSTAFDDDGNLMPGVTAAAAPWNEQLQQLRGRLLGQGMDPSTAERVAADYSQRTQNDAEAAFLVAEPDPVLVAGVGWTPDVRSAREVIDGVESRMADGSLKGPEINRAIDETYQGFLQLSSTTVRSGAPITLDQELAATRLLTLIGDLGQLAQDQGQQLSPEQQALVRQSRAFEAQRAMPEIMGAIGAGGILAARRAAGATRPTGAVGGRPLGEAETIRPNADSGTKRGIRLQNEAADTLADAGYRVEHNRQSNAPGAKNHDVFVEGRRFDVYSPEASTSASNIVSGVGRKFAQADRVVLNLSENPVSRSELRAAFAAGNTGIKEVIVIGPDKIIYRLP
jgi:Contact-dependent growth inhibition CdiA C-terminal domain